MDSPKTSVSLKPLSFWRIMSIGPLYNIISFFSKNKCLNKFVVSLLFFFVSWQFVCSLAGLWYSSFFVGGHQSACMLHFKNGVLAKVDKGLQLFLISLRNNWVEEGTLRLLQSCFYWILEHMFCWLYWNYKTDLNLRFFPLLNVRLVNFEINSFHRFATAHNFDAS